MMDKPCPFCESTDLRKTMSVKCMGCGAQANANLWNNRPTIEAQSAWMPIETAPKDGSRIVVGRDMGPWGFVRGIAHWEDIRGISGWVTTAAFSEPPGVLGLGDPTHWLAASAVTRPNCGGEK